MKNCTLSISWQNAQLKSINSHLQRKLNNLEEYNLNPKICSYCNKKLSYEQRHNKFCSSICSGHKATTGTHHTEETKNKISKSVQNSELFKIKNREAHPCTLIEKECPVCHTKFQTYINVFCSKKCHKYDQQNGHLFSKKSGGGFRPNGGRGKSGKYKG